MNEFFRKFVVYSYWKNGFIDRWLQNHFYDKTKLYLSFTLKDIINLIFLVFMVIRYVIVIRIKDDQNRLLVYLGSTLHLVGGSRFHCETLLFLWTLHPIAYYLFLLNMDSKQYKWLEIFAFLGGTISYKKIGIIFKLFSYLKKISIIQNNYFEFNI